MNEPTPASRRLWTTLFGVWLAPPWARALGERAGRARAVVLAHRRASLGLLLAAVVLAAGGLYGRAWWLARPKPVEVSMEAKGPALTDYVNAGAPRPASLEFSDSAAPLAAVGKDLTEGITITPAIEGIWHWTSDRKLDFTPKNDWPVGIAYRVVLARRVLAPQVRPERLDTNFSSAAFEPTLRKAEFYQDPVTPVNKRVEIELGFTHPVDTVELERRIELHLATQAPGTLGLGRETTPFTVTYDKSKLSAYVHSAVLAIPSEATTLAFTLDKGVRAQAGGTPASGGLSGSVTVPGRYSLGLRAATIAVATNERYEPEQVLVVGTSQLVHEREVAKHISAWVLPLQNPRLKPEGRDDSPYPWSDPSEVTAQVLKRSTRLDLGAIPAEQEQTQTHSFKLRADVGRRIYLQVDGKTQSFGGYLMRGDAQRILTVPPYPPELRILSQGALLPMSGEKKVAVLVRDLPGLRIEIARVQPSQLQHLVSQTQGNFADPHFIGSFGPDNMTDRFERKLPLPGLPPGQPHYESIDLAPYLAKDGAPKRGLFLLKVQAYDPTSDPAAKPAAVVDPNAPEAEPGEADDTENETDADAAPAPHEERRLVLVTDLGLLVKQSPDGSRDVYVQSIFSGEPVAGVSVEVIAKNGSTLFSASTDAAGHAHFDKLEGMVRERAPLAVMATKAGDMSFMPLNRGDRQLDFSRFDVGGLQNARSADQLSAYLFSDRGIYRPGETMHLGAIVKASDWARPLAGVPLEAEVLDARGLVVKKERIRLGAGGFIEISHATQATSPTGNYTVNLNILKGNDVLRQLGSLSVKVQEFLPDRMTVSAQLLTSGGAPAAGLSEGWVSPKDLRGKFLAHNLFGTPAENRRVEASMVLSPAYPAFRAWADYLFYDPQRANQSFTENLPETRTDALGDAQIDLALSRYARATYRLSLLGKVFEPEGGRSVAAEASVLVSDLPFLVGVKNDGDLGFVSRNGKRVSRIVTIGPNAAARATDGLTLQLVERQVVSVLMRQANDTYRYESRKKEALVTEQPLAVPVAGYPLTLDTAKAGNYSYVVRDAAGTELNRIDYSVAGQGNVTRSLERNAELQLTLDKKDYGPGQEIEVSIRAPYVGAGLITIERDKVFAQAWFKSTTTASVQKIRLPKDFEGNGYVNVQFIRDPGSDEIFMSPLSFGVAPFATSLARRTNPLELKVPESTRPGQPLKIKLTAEHPTRAVVFAVDEGILQVARYQNADPLGFFFQKRALEVRSAQILDLILPEFKRLMAGSAPGGDEAGANARNLNPFKRKGEAPAVYWSGIVDVNGEKEFSYPVPDHFNGTMRVMAVAVDDGAVGVAATKALVRGDFVLSPNLPGMVSPGDEFEVSVGVANNIAGSAADAAVQVTLKAAPTFDIVGPATQVIAVGAMREGVTHFRLSTKEAKSATLGSATLEFTASLGGHASTRRLDVSVRPATPFATTLALGSFTGSQEVATPRDLSPEFRRQEVAVSMLPLALTPGLMGYLDNFEHLCTEQLVSRTLPALVLARRPEFAGDHTPQSAAKALQETLRILRTRQNAQGGFGLWTASVQPDEFASAYAVHLMLEARELGVAGAEVPPDLLQTGVAYLQQLAASNPSDLPAARSRAYAIYLLTRNGAVTTPLLAGLRETLDARYGATWKTDATASFMAATYQLLKQDKPASELIGPMVKQLEAGPGSAWPRYANYDDPTIRDAQTLYLLARHFPSRLDALAAGTFARFVAPLTIGRYNTLSASWTILAIDGMARHLGGDALGKLSATQVDAQGHAIGLKLPANLLPRTAFDAGTVKLALANDASGTTWYAVTQTGFDRTPPATELKSGLEVRREYLGADGKPVSEVRIGDEVTVQLSLRGMSMGGTGDSDEQVGAVALTDLLPGGFEPVQSRDANGAASTVTGPALDFSDVREDRVVVYASANHQVQTWQYRIRATSPGRFTVPPAWAQSMYERERQARSLAGRIVVTAK